MKDWQRARYRDARGREYRLWVVVLGPESMQGFGLMSGTYRRFDGYTTNLAGEHGLISVAAEVIELLPEFADDVEIEDFERWRTGGGYGG